MSQLHRGLLAIMVVLVVKIKIIVRRR